MLPEFPKMKSIELSDREDVEKITKKYPPYSDFNFVSMWSWDIKGEMRLSQLYGNLVVRFTDYLTGEPFYSFLGDNKVNETAEMLIDFSKKEGSNFILKLVPKESIKNLSNNNFEIKEDRDNFDYIYEVENLIKMSGGKFETKRKHSHFFEKTFTHEIKILDLNDPLIKNEVVNLFNDWAIDKGKTSTDYFKNEFSALSRFLNTSQSINFFVIGIYMDNKLVSVSVTENTHDIYNLGHFQKSRTMPFKGINDYLVNKLATMLNERNIKYMNCEQDLGIVGLRESKESYLPCDFLRKFSISLVKSND